MAEKYQIPGYRAVLSHDSYESRAATATDCSREVIGEAAVVVATFYDHILAEDGDELVVISGSWLDGGFEVEDVSREANPGLGSREDVAQHYMLEMEGAASSLVAGRASDAALALHRCEEMAGYGCRDWLLESPIERLSELANSWPGGDHVLARQQDSGWI